MKQEKLDKHLDNMELFLKDLTEYRESLVGKNNTMLAIRQVDKAITVVEYFLEKLDFLGFCKTGVDDAKNETQ